MEQDDHREADAVGRAVVDAAVEVHRVLGPGWAAHVYEVALCHELGLRGIAYERQALVRMRYKDLPVGEGRLDVVVENTVVVAIGAAPQIEPARVAHLVSHLRVTRRALGLVLSFGAASMREGIQRVVLRRDVERAAAASSR